MADLTVVLAPRGTSAGIREALLDLSGLGMVHPFVWVEPQMVRGTEIACLLMEDGTQHATTLQELAGVGGVNSARLCVLVPGGADEEQIDIGLGQRIAEFMDASMGAISVVRSRLVLPRAGDKGQLAGMTLGGWHNLVLAPEESSGPGRGTKLLYDDNDPQTFGVHCAAAFASIFGLWRDSSGSPLDDLETLPGQNAALVRAYFRRLDASAVEDQLRARFTSQGMELPLPVHFGSAVTYIQEHGLAARNMSEALWTKHHGVLRGPRERPPADVSRGIGALEALKMMFGYLWAALKNAPRSWVNRVATSVKSQAAAAVHGVVFGSAPSKYTVIVGGVTPQGLPATWLDVRDAASTLDRALDSAGLRAEHEAPYDLSTLWRDYANGAMTLVDGGERTDALPPAQVGTQRAVLRHGGQAVPVASESFAQIPPHLAAAIDLEEVKPFDVLGAADMERRLRRAADDPAFGVAAAGTLQALRNWKAPFEDTYAFRVGSKIAASHAAVTEEVQQLLHVVRSAASADDMLAGIVARQKRLSVWMKALLGVLVAVTVVIGILLVAAVLDPAVAVIAFAVALLGWFVATMVTFMKGQQELFRLLHARRQLVNGDEVARKNLRHALRDLRRLGEAYSQFLAWSSIVGMVLKEPFGRVTVSGPRQATSVEGLPLNVRVATATADGAALDLAAAQLRHDLFVVGWLTRSWELAISDAGRVLGARGHQLSGQQDAIFRQPGDGDMSLLPEWIGILQDRGIGTTAGDELWAAALAHLTDGRSDTAGALLRSVTEVRSTAPAESPLHEFMSELAAAGRGEGRHYFDGAVLSDGAQSSDQAAVVQSFYADAQSGLSKQMTLVQLSVGIPEHDFVVVAGGDGGDDDEIDARNIVVPSGPVF
ncbi:hypothetical protein AB0N24_06930 [Arthrobacter sp. NPDC093128]|uniref:hypothetical protein n=1 Tax=Arthrobacter sp. NPDC093128 TaxID=3154979 RepID=UPI00343911A4